jgi:hypothetical protein
MYVLGNSFVPCLNACGAIYLRVYTNKGIFTLRMQILQMNPDCHGDFNPASITLCVLHPGQPTLDA